MFWIYSTVAKTTAHRVAVPAATGTARGAGMQRVRQPAHLRSVKEHWRAPRRITPGVPLMAPHPSTRYPRPQDHRLLAGQQRGGRALVVRSHGLGAFDIRSPWVLGAVGVVAAIAGIYFVQKGLTT